MRRIVIIKIAILVIAALSVFAEGRAEEKQPEWTVKSVNIEGNKAFKDDELLKLMVNSPSGWFRSRKYHHSVFQDDLSALDGFYRQNGYLNVEITDTTVSRDRDENHVRIFISIDEGPVTSVEGISILGNRAFPDSTLMAMLKLETGTPFMRKKLQDGMIAIATFYADNGYLDASVTPEIRINEREHRAIIDLIIDEGRQMTISDIEIRGLDKTRDFVVRRELNFKKGEIISHRKLMKSQRQLYLTGLFNSVSINPAKRPGDPEGQRALVVELKEKDSGRFSVSAGYGSIERAMGRVEISFGNLFGTARQAGMRVKANFIERKVEGSFSEPRTMGSRFTTDLNLFYSYQNQPGFDVSRHGGLLTFGRNISSSGHLTLGYRHENQRLSNVEILELPERSKPRLRSITLGLTNDTRDDLFNPSGGWFLDFSYELAGTFLGGTDAFNRTVLNLRCFRSVGLGAVLAASFEAGWIDIYGASGGVPINELFYTGGPNSIRGFEYRKVGPLDAGGNPVGGQFELVLNGEIRKAVWRWIGVAVFLDAGNVWRRIRHCRFDSFRYAAGPGVRINTPIGIVRFDAGFNPDPREGEEKVRYYIVMGNAF